MVFGFFPNCSFKEHGWHKFYSGRFQNKQWNESQHGKRRGSPAEMKDTDYPVAEGGINPRYQETDSFARTWLSHQVDIERTHNRSVNMRSLLKNCRRLPQSDTGQTIIGKRTTLWNNSIFANAPKESLSNVTPSTPRRLPRRSQKPNTPSSPQLHLTLSNPGSRALIMQQTCRGSLYAVSKPIFASIHSFAIFSNSTRLAYLRTAPKPACATFQISYYFAKFISLSGVLNFCWIFAEIKSSQILSQNVSDLRETPDSCCR